MHTKNKLSLKSFTGALKINIHNIFALWFVFFFHEKKVKKGEI